MEVVWSCEFIHFCIYDDMFSRLYTNLCGGWTPYIIIVVKKHDMHYPFIVIQLGMKDFVMH